MTPDEQRIAIAEKCGFRRDIEKTVPFRAIWWGVKYEQHGEQCHTFSDLPDYLGDLNWMYKAESTLRHKETFVIMLHRVCNNFWGPWDLPYTQFQWKYVHSTAAQRAEAFLRTVDLWTGPKIPENSAQ